MAWVTVRLLDSSAKTECNCQVFGLIKMGMEAQALHFAQEAELQREVIPSGAKADGSAVTAGSCRRPGAACTECVGRVGERHSQGLSMPS